MKLYLYNTLTRQKEEFVPIVPGKVGMYSCGPTVYWTPSIGNYRATFTADLLRNTFKLFGYEVTSVMNFTDVGHLVGDGDQGEDKLEKGAKRDGISAWDVAKKYEQIFVDGMHKLNIDLFTHMPRATEHIQQQINLVKTLESKGYTYVVEGDGIYMDTSKVENYGELIGPNYKKRLEDLHAGERVTMGGKKNPTDFALWKFSPTDEKRQMEWESPRGIGFPGWHIECSAMSSEYLGQQFDVHHGGADHITIHHPNEIAQSECAFDHHPWVKYRVHNEFLKVDGGKMSKSLGNVYNLDDIESRGYSPLDLRYFYFTAQFGNFQNFTRENLEAAKNARLNLKKKINMKIQSMGWFINSELLTKNLSQMEQLLKDDPNAESNILFFSQIIGAISDNINTPLLLSVINKLGLLSKPNISFLYRLDHFFLKLNLFSDIEKTDSIDDISVEIQSLARQRLEAKERKDYNQADILREKLKQLLEKDGIVLLDKRDEKGNYIEISKNNIPLGEIRL